jgi:hypothetical protein
MLIPTARQEDLHEMSALCCPRMRSIATTGGHFDPEQAETAKGGGILADPAAKRPLPSVA